MIDYSPLIRWGAIAVFVVIACAGLVRCGSDMGAARVQAKWDADRTAAAEAHASALAEARAREQLMQADFDAAAAQWEQDRGEIEASSERLAADLRAGAVRLHQRWQACAATAGLSGAAHTAAGPDGGAEDRAASAARIVAAGAACDAQVRGLQALIRSER